MSLYNCKQIGNNYRIVKFDNDFEVEATYELKAGVSGKYYCNCFQAKRESCRHRDMLKQFIAAGYVDTKYFLDFENWRWAVPFKGDGT